MLFHKLLVVRSCFWRYSHDQLGMLLLYQSPWCVATYTCGGAPKVYDFRGLFAIPEVPLRISSEFHGYYWPILTWNTGHGFLVGSVVMWSESRVFLVHPVMVRSCPGDLDIFVCYPLLQGGPNYLIGLLPATEGPGEISKGVWGCSWGSACQGLSITWKGLSSLVLDEIEWLQMDQCVIWGSSWTQDSWSRSRWRSWLGRSLLNLNLTLTLSWIQKPFSHSYPGYLLYRLLQCPLFKAILEEYLEVATGEECDNVSNPGCR